MNSALAIPAPTIMSADPVHRIGFFLLSLYFFLAYSRVLDITVPGFHIPLMVGLALYGMAALAGSIQRALATTPGKLLVALTGCMVLAALFGAWRGGSAKVLVDNWAKAFPFYFTVVGLCLTTGQIFRFMRTIAVATFVMACVALWRGDHVMGRLIVANSRFGDPNDMAVVCLISIALCGFLVTRKQMFLKKLAAVTAGSVLLYAVARTGSRGAFLAFAAGLAYLFWTTSATGKVKMIIALVATVFLAAVALPPEVYFRYATLFSDEAPVSEAHEMTAAENSADARLHLLVQSVYITMQHPLLGVGPGNFAVAENDVAQSQGRRRGAWHDTHNMYTQISSENGVPAAILYIAVLLLALRATKRTMRIAKQHRDADTVEKAAFWLRVAMLTFGVSGFFLSIAYCDMLPLLSGLAIALELAVKAEIPKTVKGSGAAPVAVAPAYAGARA